jgi:hypothetical protein
MKIGTKKSKITSHTTLSSKDVNTRTTVEMNIWKIHLRIVLINFDFFFEMKM